MTAHPESARTAEIISRRAKPMADHKHGEMDITVQEKTFDGFMTMVTRATIGIIVFLVFLALVGG